MTRSRKIKIGVATVIAIGLLWWIFSNDYDSSKPTKFYKIDNYGPARQTYETYVVHNAPYDTAEIRKIIEKFNFETIPLDTIKKYNGFGRKFYRETKYMTRHFKEGDEYDPEYSSWDNTMDFRNHDEDILMTTGYSIGEDGRIWYRYWLYWDYKKHIDKMYSNAVYRIFYDLDSFYVAKRKEYGIE